MNYKISVIVPAYNVAPWIQKTVESILRQSYPHLEVIVVNNSSTDGTGAILDAIVDSRLTVIHQENTGVVAARETGIRHATGDYVTFVDGDDTIEPDMYERLLANAIQYDADISHCGISFDFPDGHTEAHYGTGAVLVQDTVEGLRELLSGERVEPTLCNKLYARHLFADYCPDVSLRNNEDLLRNFTLFGRANRSVFEDFCGYHYFQRPGSASKDVSRKIQIMEHIFRARRLILDNCSDELFPHAMRLWLSAYVNAIQQNCGDSGAEVRAFVKKCRRTLRRERKNICFLIRRQRWAARLILYAPWLHRMIYKLYDRRRGTA